MVLLNGLEDEAGLGFAAGAVFRVLRHAAVGVMWAVVEGVEVGADGCEVFVHPVVNAEDVAFGEIAARNAALVRDDDGEEARVVDVFDGFAGTGEPFEVFGAVEVVDVDVQGAVSVEKDCWLHRSSFRGREVLFVCVATG